MPKTILLVEDEAIVALAEAKALRSFGYHVRTVGTGEEAVEAIRRGEEDVDLILMDIELGEGIDGTEAARRILALGDLPIVFLSAHSEREQAEKVQRVPRYGYVIKDSGDFVLQSSIEMAFELFEAHKSMRAGETRLSILLKTIPDLIWLKDLNGVYLSCNSAFERFIGAREAEIVGKTDYDLFEKEQADFFREKDRTAATVGKPSINEEWITLAEDGRRIKLETIKTPMFDDAGECIGVLGIGRDITERDRFEEALKESEKRVRRKLDALIEPEGDIEELSISDIVDVPTIRSLMEDFSALSGMVVAILDLQGTILLATGWQDICTKFHRMSPKSAAACTESDLHLSASLKPGEVADYKCKNNLWDVVTPLYIGSRHVGNIYSGQFFYEDDHIDESVFVAQAERYGFDKAAYLAALRRVPRFNRALVARLMGYLVRLTEYVSRLSYSNLRLARAVDERRRAEELLSKSVAEKEMLLKELQHRVKNSLSIVSSLLTLNMAELSDEYSIHVFQEAANRVRSVAMIYEELSQTSSISRVNLGKYCGDLLELLRNTYAAAADKLRVISELASIDCDLKRAVSLGLILNELFTNALKYAYPQGATGEVRVSLAEDRDSIELRVCDDGPGLPAGLDVKQAKSLGLRIAGVLAEELGGTLAFEPGPGARAVLRFPNSDGG
jgi:PAS domain S-box-containing protein